MADLDKKITEFTKDCSDKDIKKLIEDLGFDKDPQSVNVFNPNLVKRLGQNVIQFEYPLILKLST